MRCAQIRERNDSPLTASLSLLRMRQRAASWVGRHAPLAICVASPARVVVFVEQLSVDRFLLKIHKRTSRFFKMRQIGTLFVLAVLAAFDFGCASLAPAKVNDPSFIRAAGTKEKDNVLVTVAVLTATESRDYFGRPLEPGVSRQYG